MSERIEKLVAELTLDEKAALAAGVDLWHGPGVDRLGVPPLKVTDGPSGARGEQWSGRPSANFPCGTALGATWNPELVHEVGKRLGVEARRKQAHALLAPTVNIHRHPLAGRNFECYSEDPFLSARMAVAYITGVQSQGVGCTVKHFVANDSEFERMTISSEVDERTLREISLVPFEAAVNEAGTWALMTAYNRVNGPYCSEHARADRDAARRVGLRRPRHVRLVRHAQHGARRERRARSRDAGTAAVLRREARGGGARGRGSRGRCSTTRRTACSR